MLQRTAPSVSCPGVDRVLWVRVRVHGGTITGGVVHGIRHRRPVEVTVSAETASRLARAGVPAITDRAA